jgi:Rap/ran-GAP/GTPase-activator protein for Ras-like GTPase
VLGSKRGTRLRAGSYSAGTEQLNTQRLEREALLKGTAAVLKRRKWKISYVLIAHGLIWQFNTPQEMALLDSWEMETLASVARKPGVVHGKEHCLELFFVGAKGRTLSKRQLSLVISLESEHDRIVWHDRLNELLQQANASPQVLRRRGSTTSSMLSISSGACSAAPTSPGRPGTLLSQECDLIEQQAPDSDADPDFIAVGVHALQEADPQLASYEEIEYEPTPALQRALDRKLKPEVRARVCRVLCMLLNESRSAQPEQKLSQSLVTDDPGHLNLAAMCAFSEVLGDHAPLGEEFPMQMILFFEEHRGDHALELVHWAVNTEVARTIISGAKHTPFRSTNLYTSLITSFFFGNEGRTFLIRTIGEDVARLARSRTSLEVDPKRARKGIDVKGNLKKLLGEAQGMVSKIFNSIDTCPISVRRVLAHAQHVVKQHFPDLRRLVVGSFMFLRFLCPALVSPTRYGILLDEPTDQGMRALQLIAKLMLNLAHNVEFDGSKESYMSKMNHFITRNMSPLNAFFDRLVDEKDIRDRIKATTVRFNVVQPPDPTVLLAYHEYLCSRLLPTKLIPLLRDLRPEEQDEAAYSLLNSDSAPTPTATEAHLEQEVADGESTLPGGSAAAAAGASGAAEVAGEGAPAAAANIALTSSSTPRTPRTYITTTTEAIACTETDMDSDEEQPLAPTSLSASRPGVTPAEGAGELPEAAATATLSSAAPCSAASLPTAAVPVLVTAAATDDQQAATASSSTSAATAANKPPDSPTGTQYRFFHSHKIKPLVDLWPTKPRPKRTWPEDARQVHEGDPVMVELACLPRECSLELGSKREHYSAENEFHVEDDEMHNAFFYDYLYNREHINYIARPEAHETEEGPVVLTIERSTRGGRGEKLKAIIRFDDEDVRVFVAGVGHGRSRSFTGGMGAIRRKDNYLRYLVSVCPRLAGVKSALMRVDDPALSENLLKFEQQITIKRTFKFGVLPCAAGVPMTEEAMLGTRDISPALHEFLDWLGDKVRLQRWAHFRGGLDVKTDTTGTHSYYTEHRGFEIMYHVAPLLPYTEGDKQQLARKRHLGNDVVTIVFNESEQPFDESVIRSHFQHVFLVVRPEGTPDDRRYRVAFVNRAGVDPYGPFLPYPAVFPKDQSARDFLLTKCTCVLQSLVLEWCIGGWCCECYTRGERESVCVCACVRARARACVRMVDLSCTCGNIVCMWMCTSAVWSLSIHCMHRFVSFIV